MTLAAYVLHYGAEYLPYSIRSIYDSVDAIAIFYSSKPSHGHITDVDCPETEEQLKKAAFSYDPDNKIKWFNVWASQEGQHRNTYLDYAKKMEYDIVVVVDSDEVWDRDSLEDAIAWVGEQSAAEYRVPFVHFWKKFNQVCHDLAQPVRFHRLKGEGLAYVPLKKPVYHFGYAISDQLMTYKWLIHGHLNELRPEWFAEKWFGTSLQDVHPTNKEGFWNVETFNPEELPELMHEHPKWKNQI